MPGPPYQKYDPQFYPPSEQYDPSSSYYESSRTQQGMNVLTNVALYRVEVRAAPIGLELAHHHLLTPPAVNFVAKLVQTFDTRVQQVRHQSYCLIKAFLFSKQNYIQSDSKPTIMI